LELTPDTIEPRYRAVLDKCTPFVISHTANYPSLDFAPFGVQLAEEHIYTATSLRSRDVVDGLHHLDSVTFGDQGMLMPRWVLFDCGEFPGIVFGFGCRAGDLPDYARAAYHVSERNDVFVPLSMWAAIRCAEPDAWFGHNLSSANLMLKGDDKFPGLALLTKLLAVKLTKSTKQYGATQWDSRSVGLHLRMGPMHLLSAYTPAHTHAETFTYRIDVDEAELVSSVLPGWSASNASEAHTMAADDSAAIRKLHDEIEAGAHWQLLRAERRKGKPQLLHLRRAPDRSGLARP
jgi:hypothetical protein